MVSGVVEDKKGKTTLSHARAKVVAQVSDRIEVRVSYQQLQEVETDQVVRRNYLELFGFRIPLFFKADVGPNYHVETEKKPLELFGLKLPFRFIRETYKITQVKQVTLTEQQAKDQALQQLETMEQERFAGGAIQDAQKVGQAEKNEYVLIADYICEQDIALQQEFYTDSPMR